MRSLVLRARGAQCCNELRGAPSTRVDPSVKTFKGKGSGDCGGVPMSATSTFDQPSPVADFCGFITLGVPETLPSDWPPYAMPCCH